jgi:hypothetical protein
MKAFKDYYAKKQTPTYKGVTYVNKYLPLDQAVNVKSVRILLNWFITDNHTGQIAHTWFGASNKEEGNEEKSKQELEMMLYENLYADIKYPNFANTIFSCKQFVGKFPFTVTNTYGYPKEGIAVKHKDTLTKEEEKIVNRNTMLISITDHTRHNLCHSEAILVKKVGKSIEKYQLKKDADLKQNVTVTEVEQDASAASLSTDNARHDPSEDARQDQSNKKCKSVDDSKSTPAKTGSKKRKKTS